MTNPVTAGLAWFVAGVVAVLGLAFLVVILA
jgi:hypothetical protein